MVGPNKLPKNVFESYLSICGMHHLVSDRTDPTVI